MTVLSVAAAYLVGPAGRRAAGGSAAFVRAFTPRALDAVGGGSTRTRSSTGSAASNLISSRSAPSRRMFSSAVVRDDDEDEAPLTQMQMSTTVEDDLDAALDDILSGAFQDAGDVAVAERDDDAEDSDLAAGGSTANGAHAIPEPLVLTEDFDYRDPKFTNTSNPFWLEAGLSQDVIDVLSHKGIVNLTPVQAEAFTPVVAGRDVIGRSRTGTGKTLAFGMPSVTRLVELAKQKGNMDAHGRMKRGRGVSMIVLCPTRELARQVEEELNSVARPLGLFTACFHGGVSDGPQAGAIRSGLDILVGTPGRIMDHLNRGNLNLSECEIAVLDEADEMLNMGFAEDVEVILEGIGSANAEKTQCLLFSATTPPWVKEIGRQYQRDVLTIDSTTQDGDGASRAATTVQHVALQVPPGTNSKRAILEDIIAVEISKGAEKKLDAMANGAIGDGEEAEYENPIAAAAIAKKKKSGHLNQKIFGKTIVFVETKREADELVSGGVFKSLTPPSALVPSTSSWRRMLLLVASTSRMLILSSSSSLLVILTLTSIALVGPGALDRPEGPSFSSILVSPAALFRLSAISATASSSISRGRPRPKPPFMPLLLHLLSPRAVFLTMSPSTSERPLRHSLKTPMTLLTSLLVV